MNLRASAPGKLVLLGEYAVLEGAPALVMAADRRAVAELIETDGPHEVHAPEVHPTPVQFTLGADGVADWHDRDPAVATRLVLVSQVLQGLAAHGLLPAASFRLKLDSAAFFARLPDGDTAKLGLGSSAAMTAVLASVVASFAGHGQRVADRAGWLATLLQIHRQFQGGRGSGVDVGAAVYGGVIRYQLADGKPAARLVGWPSGLRRLWVWSGQSASTSRFLQTLDQWRAINRDAYRRHMQGLTDIAVAGVRAAESGDAPALRQQLATAADALHRLGEASKIPIFSTEHRRIAKVVEGAGGVYKPCGAGGGDLGLAVAGDDESCGRIRAALAASGHVVLDLGVDHAGLVLDQVARSGGLGD